MTTTVTSPDYLSHNHPWLLFLILLGAYTLLKRCLALLAALYAYFLRPAKDLRRYGQWAILTGPTAGIGHSLALELARRGVHLILVGRDEEKLRGVTRKIHDGVSPSVQVRSVLFDLSGDIDGGVRRVKAAMEGLDVGLLVNNAGVAKPSALYFHEVDVEKWLKMVKVNLVAPTAMMVAVLPAMLAKRRGAVVNIGSGSAVALPSFPLYTVYASTKRYIAQLSRSLHLEYKNKGIDIQCQAPLYVSTKMVSWAVKAAPRGSLFVPSSERYAKASLRWVGRGALCMPNFGHYLQWLLAAAAPDALNDAVRLRVNLRQRDIINGLRSELSRHGGQRTVPSSAGDDD